jgi:Arc/MetJ family transcription regulator
VYDDGLRYTEVRVRTNIEIDDELMGEAMRLTGLKTKKAVVEEALRHLVRLKRQAKIADYFGKLPWEGDLERWRLDEDPEDHH